MMRVALLDDYQGIGTSMGSWDEVGDDVDIVSFRDHIDDEDELAAQLLNFDVVVAMRERTPLRESLLERLNRLRLIVTTGPSNAVIDVEAASRRGIVVSGTGGILTPTSELTWALILALTKRIPGEDAAVRAGAWQESISVDLAGRRLGLIGLGRLGAMVARVGLAFGMDVVAWSQNLTQERCAEVGVRRVDRTELFTDSDIVSIHLVLSDRTRGLVGEKELRAMRRSAFLVNTSRGPIVNEQALIRALNEKWIAGAGLDVFNIEPLPASHPLRFMPNTVLTPHIGYVTENCYRLFWTEIVEDIAAFRRGQPIRVVGR